MCNKNNEKVLRDGIFSSQVKISDERKKLVEENRKFIERGYLVGDPSDVNLKELKPLSKEELNMLYNKFFKIIYSDENKNQ